MEREKLANIIGSGLSSEIKIEDLKDDRVVLRSGPGGLEALEVGADGGFIKRLDKVEKRHKRKTQLTKDIMEEPSLPKLSLRNDLKKEKDSNVGTGSHCAS